MASNPEHINEQIKCSFNLPLNEEDAKAMVFDQWQFLSRLAERRFPNDDSTAQEALLFVLSKLEENQWKRIRTWEGLGAFHTFLAILTARLMTDYARSKFGHLRPPTWINNKNDPVWTRAYKLIVFENNSRQDAIEILTASHPTRDRWYFEEMISTILAKSNRSVRAIESQIPIEAIADSNADANSEPVYASNNKELLEAVIGYLSDDDNSSDDSEDFQVKRLLSLLNIELSMSQEDKLLLKMRYCDGMSIAAIYKILNLQGDTYKRINKLIKHLSNACMQMGVLESA